MPAIRLLKTLRLYLLHEAYPSPLSFFAYFALRYLLPQSDYHWTLHFLALFLASVRNYNMLYLLPTFLYVQNYLISLLFFATSLLACTRKWKLYLFIFVAADSYLIPTQQQFVFMALASLGFCLAIYKSLFFQNNSDNRQYFIGFAIMLAISTIKILLPSISMQSKVVWVVVLGVTVGFLSRTVLQIRMNAIKSLQLEKIKDPSIIARYIDILLQDFHNPAFKSARLQLHKRQCIFLTCYCKKAEYSDNSQFYLQQMFENLMRRLGSLEDEHLWAYYIEFYLKREQVLTAYYFLLKWRPASYFPFLSKLKCEARIADFLEKKNVQNPFVKQYIYGLQYDTNRLYLSIEIHEILKLKIDFWKEVGKESLGLQKLQALGTKIVERMYRLNTFYCNTIKQQEKYLYCFDSTVLYGMYLISTTNFKDYAKTIIKSASKQMQEAYITERNASQTFVIRAVIKNIKRSNPKHSNNCLVAEPLASVLRYTHPQPFSLKCRYSPTENQSELVRQSWRDFSLKEFGLIA